MSGSTKPTAALDRSVNQTFPSGPAAIESASGVWAPGNAGVGSVWGGDRGRVRRWNLVQLVAIGVEQPQLVTDAGQRVGRGAEGPGVVAGEGSAGGERVERAIAVDEPGRAADDGHRDCAVGDAGGDRQRDAVAGRGAVAVEDGVARAVIALARVDAPVVTGGETPASWERSQSRPRPRSRCRRSR